MFYERENIIARGNIIIKWVESIILKLDIRAKKLNELVY